MERGQDWATLNECKRLHLLTVYDSDAAQCRSTYVNVTLRKPNKLSIKPYYNRVKEMDDLAPRLPCLTDEYDCPTEIPRYNASMIDFQMCSHLMRMTTPKIEAEYYYLNDTTPTDSKELVAWNILLK